MGKYIEVDSTALLKIIGYKGYRKGSPFDCTIDSNPRDVSGNVVYNFSYYNPDGDTGVIGSGEDKMVILYLFPLQKNTKMIICVLSSTVNGQNMWRLL